MLVLGIKKVVWEGENVGVERQKASAICRHVVNLTDLHGGTQLGE